MGILCRLATKDGGTVQSPKAYELALKLRNEVDAGATDVAKETDHASQTSVHDSFTHYEFEAPVAGLREAELRLRHGGQGVRSFGGRKRVEGASVIYSLNVSGEKSGALVGALAGAARGVGMWLANAGAPSLGGSLATWGWKNAQTTGNRTYEKVESRCQNGFTLQRQEWAEFCPDGSVSYYCNKNMYSAVGHGGGSHSSPAAESDTRVAPTDAPDPSPAGGQPGTEMGEIRPETTAKSVSLNCTPQQAGTAAFRQRLAELTSSGVAVSITLVNSADAEPQIAGQ